MRKGKVGVIGLTGQSAFLTAERFPQPGETISCSSLFFEPGGKGHNQAVACARMGAETVFVGAVGEDANGEACSRALKREGITACLIQKKEPTAFAVITTAADGENTVEVFPGATRNLRASDFQSEIVRDSIKGCDYLLIQNELSGECLAESLSLARELGVKVIFNPAPAGEISKELLAGCELITPNYGEAKCLAGFSSEEDPPIKAFGDFFREVGIRKGIITMGGRGVMVIEDGECVRVPALSCGEVKDTTGAGDTFNGVLAARLAMGESLEHAVQTAVAAAGLSVTRRGAVGGIPRRDEVIKLLQTTNR